MTEDRAADALREKVAEALSAHHHPMAPWAEVTEWWRDQHRREADAVLAALDLPALLAAERARGREEALREAADIARSFGGGLLAERLVWGIEDEPLVEIGGITMTQTQWEAATTAARSTAAPLAEPTPTGEGDRCLPGCSMDGEIEPDGSGTTWIDHEADCPRLAAAAPTGEGDRG